MSEITMCKSEICPFKKYCYRSTAVPNSWQSYANLEEFEEDNFGKCANFMCNKIR